MVLQPTETPPETLLQRGLNSRRTRRLERPRSTEGRTRGSGQENREAPRTKGRLRVREHVLRKVKTVDRETGRQKRIRSCSYIRWNKKPQNKHRASSKTRQRWYGSQSSEIRNRTAVDRRTGQLGNYCKVHDKHRTTGQQLDELAASRDASQRHYENMGKGPTRLGDQADGKDRANGSNARRTEPKQPA